MAPQFNPLRFVKKLLLFSPRQGENETKAAEYIIDTLREKNIPYLLHRFSTRIPNITHAHLFADGKKIPCDGVSFRGGKITGKENIFSSSVSSDDLSWVANINFNPKGNALSRCTFYFAPAVAIGRKYLARVLEAEHIEGEVRVKPKAHRSLNILVGNTTSPRAIVFAHYDSVGTGAVDNASGVATMMHTILTHPETQKHVLYVFSGNEELSYHGWPEYWGHGYREFEKKYARQMAGCKKLIVVDSLGNGKTVIRNDKHLVYLAFPIKNMNKWLKKTSVICGDFEKLMAVYHSDSDDGKQVKNEFLLEGSRILAQKVVNA